MFPKLRTSSATSAIVAAIDAKKVSGVSEVDRWEVFTHGGRRSTRIDAVEFALSIVELGTGKILLTPMDRDGAQSGYDMPLPRAHAT